MKAKIIAFQHQVTENCESLDRHIAKDAARQQQRRKAAEREQDAADAVAVAPVALQVGGFIPPQIWNDADAGQRAAWEAVGLKSA